MKPSPGQLSELRLAIYLEGESTLASGATRGDKSDIKLDWTPEKMRVECKSTTTGSLSVQRAWLLKIAAEARETERMPVFSLSFTDGRGKSRAGEDWIALRKEDWIELMRRLVEAETGVPD